MRAADIRPLLPPENEPAQIVEDHLLGLTGRARLIGIFNADDERAAVMTREEPVEDRRARAPDVKVACGRRGEADADRHLRRSVAEERRRPGDWSAGVFAGVRETRAHLAGWKPALLGSKRRR